MELSSANQPKHVTPSEGEMLHVIGDDVRVLVSGAETGGAFAVVETVTPPGGGPPPHMHTREDETFLVLEGTIEFFVGGDTLVLGPGHFAFAPKDVPHHYRNAGAGPAKMMVTLIPAGFEEKFFRPVSERIGKNPPDMAFLVPLAEENGLKFLM